MEIYIKSCHSLAAFCPCFWIEVVICKDSACNLYKTITKKNTKYHEFSIGGINKQNIMNIKHELNLPGMFSQDPCSEQGCSQNPFWF